MPFLKFFGKNEQLSFRSLIIAEFVRQHKLTTTKTIDITQLNILHGIEEKLKTN